MFVIAIFVVVFGLFVLAVYGSKRVIDENAGDNSLMRVVRTYEVNDKEYWLRLEIVFALYFIILGSVIGMQIFVFHPPNDLWAVLMVDITILMMVGLGAVILYGNFNYRFLTKNRSITFDPETKSVMVTENDEEIKFEVRDIEMMTCFIAEGKLSFQYWEWKLKNGEVLLFDPRFFPVVAIGEFFQGIPNKLVYSRLPSMLSLPKRVNRL